MQKKIIAAFTFLPLLLLSSCSNTNKNDKNILVITDSQKVDKVLLKEVLRFNQSIPGLLLFSQLLYLDEHEIWHNLLAKEVEVLPGRKVIEVKLRDGVKFHDGRLLTADDIVASINKLRSVDKRYKNLKVEKLNSMMLRLTSDMPTLEVNSLLANIVVFAPESSDQSVGTGPFRFSRWLNNGVELVANDNYLEGRPKLDKVIYLYEEDERKRLTKLLNGEADLLVFLSPEAARFLEKDNRFYVNKVPFLYSVIHFNCESPLFSSKAIRKAVSMAIDRDSLINKWLNGGEVKTSHPFPSEMLIEPNAPDYQPREAARLLREDGWKDGNKDGILEKAGKKLGFALYYDKGSEEHKKVVDLMSQHLFEVGIEMEGIPVNLEEFNKTRVMSGDYDAFLLGHSSSDSVNFTVWHSSFIGDPDGRNYSRYGNKVVDRLLEQMRRAPDIETKKRTYARMHEIFDEDAPAAFLYNSMIYTAVSKRFKGAEDFVGDIYSVYKIKDWSVNEDIR